MRFCERDILADRDLTITRFGKVALHQPARDHLPAAAAQARAGARACG